MVRLIGSLGRLTLMHSASTLFHRNWIVSALNGNHILRVTCSLLRNNELLGKINRNPSIIAVSFPWNDNKAFTSIRPHVALMQQIMQVKDKQSELVNDFIQQLRATLEEMGVDGGQMSENNLRSIHSNFEDRLNRIGVLDQTQQHQLPGEVERNRVENGRKYNLHTYGNKMRRVPEDWIFPRCGVADLYRHDWWIGDSVRQIPPLKYLEKHDVSH